MALASGAAAPAFAAEAAPAAASTANTVEDLTEIVVTARRIEENLQDVPISITVFNQQQLENRNVVTAADLAQYVPSLTVDTNFGSDNTSFSLRGFGQDNGTAPAVGVFFADVIAPRAASNSIPGGDGAGPGSFFDLENVQILKGPQGTLFGRNTTGGDILLVPKKPTSELSGYIEGGGGNYDDGEFQAVGNLPINDSFRVRAGVVRETREGYLTSNSGIGPSDFNNVNYTAARLSAVLDVLPNLENYTIFSYSSSHTNGDLGKLIAAGPVPGAAPLFLFSALAQQAVQGSRFYDIQQSFIDPYSRLQQWQAINTTTWKVADNLTVKNIASYAQLRDSLNDGLFGTNFLTPSAAALPPGAAPIFAGVPAGVPFLFAGSAPNPGSSTANEHTITEELQFQGTGLDDRLQWQAGGYFETALPRGFVGSLSPVNATCLTTSVVNCSDTLGYALANIYRLGGAPVGAFVPLASQNETIGETRYRDYAFYTQSTFKLTDQWKLTGGLRYTNDYEEAIDIQKATRYQPYPFTGLLTFPPGLGSAGSPFCSDAGVLPSCQVTYTQNSHAPTWLADVDYTPIQDLLLYAKYSRGYREGTINPTAPPPLNIVQPEKVDAYEIGEKTSFRGVINGTLNAAAFYNNLRNQQLQVGFNENFFSPTPGNPFAAPLNIGKSRIWGFELDSSLKLFPGFRLDVGYTYLNTEIQSVNVPTLPPTSPWITAGAQKPGDPLELSPKNKVTVTGTYTLPLPDAFGTVSFGPTFTHTDKQLANYIDATLPAPFTNLSYLQPTNLLNFNLNWNEIMRQPIDLTLYATNITSQKYYTYVAGLASGTEFETASIGPPLFYGARIRIHFH
jgi:iron complex outermembrane receptor protein